MFWTAVPNVFCCHCKHGGPSCLLEILFQSSLSLSLSCKGNIVTEQTQKVGSRWKSVLYIIFSTNGDQVEVMDKRVAVRFCGRNKESKKPSFLCFHQLSFHRREILFVRGTTSGRDKRRSERGKEEISFDKWLQNWEGNKTVSKTIRQ